MLNKLDFVKEEIRSILGVEQKPKRIGALKYFFARIGQAVKLVFTEKEIILFALLQWVAIGLGYFLWVQMLNWIPDEVWRSAENSDSGSIADVVLLAWSFIIVGIVALPIGILNACIGAVHFLHRQGRPSTIATCLQIVLPRVWPLWVFSWTDSWITVWQILKRLPKKRGSGNSVLSETLYYAWKLGTIGVLPALLSGRGLIDAGKDSVLLVKNKIADTSLLRVGYSLICWVIGVSTYIGTIFFFIFFDNLVPDGEIYSTIYEFYFWAGVPILVSVGVILLFLRPIYTISSADIYADYLQEQNQPLFLPKPPSKTVSAIVAVFVLLAIIGAVVLYRDQLGITAMLAMPYTQENSPEMGSGNGVR
ncbi:MAG: hypothetical protein Q7S26_03945 [bacterium]|nr:hypothetical protein [bacterium]